MSTTPHPIKNTGGPPPVQRRRRKTARKNNPTLDDLFKFEKINYDKSSQPKLTLKVVSDKDVTDNQNKKRNLSDTSFGSTRNDSNKSDVSSSAGELSVYQEQGRINKILDDFRKKERAGIYRFKPVNELYETDESQTPSITFGGKKKKTRKKKTKRRRRRTKKKSLFKKKIGKKRRKKRIKKRKSRRKTKYY